MSKGSPSLVALLGLLAVAGYQNRDKLTGMMQGATASDQTTNRASNTDSPFQMPQSSAVGGMAVGGMAVGGMAVGGMAVGEIIGNLRGMLTGNGGLAAGLSELLGRFTNPVQSARAESWVGTGPNSALGSQDLRDVLDDETLDDLAQKTGLAREELLIRLSAVLPAAVDRLTPQGRLPTEDEARILI